MYASVLPGTAIVIESFELERTHKGHLVQVPYHEQGHLQLDQFAQRPVQPDLVCLQGWSTYHLSGNLFQCFTEALSDISTSEATSREHAVILKWLCLQRAPDLDISACTSKSLCEVLHNFRWLSFVIEGGKQFFFFFCIFVFLWLLFGYLVLICGCWKGRNLLQLSYCKSSMLSEGTVCASVEESLYDPARLIFMFHFVTIWKKKW